MLDDNRREAVMVVGDFRHPTSLPRNRAPDPDRYPDNTVIAVGVDVRRADDGGTGASS